MIGQVENLPHGRLSFCTSRTSWNMPAPNPPNPHARLTCPTCGRRFLLDETGTPPFCSERCQLVDLGRWLDEEHGLPFEGEPGETPVEYQDQEGDEDEP